MCIIYVTRYRIIFIFFSLQKHLMHLKVIQQMSRVPRSICGPQLTSDNSLTDALGSTSPPSSTTSSASSSTATQSMVNYAGDSDQMGPATSEEGQMNPLTGVGGDVRINPLSGLGLTEERYQAILKDLVNGDGLTGVGVPEDLTFGLIGGSNTGGMDVGLGVGVGVGVGLGAGMGMSEKRGLDEDGDAMREGKRGRFEVLD